MSWIFFALCATVLWASVNVFDKYTLSKLVNRPLMPLIIIAFMGLMIGVVTLAGLGFPVLSEFDFLLAFIAGIFYLAMNLFYLKAVQIEEISKVVPLFSLSPLFLMVLAVLFLDETLSPAKYEGVCLIVTGAILISSNRLTFQFNRAFALMILSALCAALYDLTGKQLLATTDFWTIFAYVRIGTFLAILPLLPSVLKEIRSLYRRQGLRPLGLMTLGQTAGVLANLPFTMALALGPVTLVSATASTQPLFVFLFTLLLSIFFPHLVKEEITRAILARKLFSILLIVVGVFLIS